jgi:hypothetical protein
MAQPARQREKAGKLYPPAIQRLISLQPDVTALRLLQSIRPYSLLFTKEAVAQNARIKGRDDQGHFSHYCTFCNTSMGYHISKKA